MTQFFSALVPLQLSRHLHCEEPLRFLVSSPWTPLPEMIHNMIKQNADTHAICRHSRHQATQNISKTFRLPGLWPERFGVSKCTCASQCDWVNHFLALSLKCPAVCVLHAGSRHEKSMRVRDVLSVQRRGVPKTPAFASGPKLQRSKTRDFGSQMEGGCNPGPCVIERKRSKKAWRNFRSGLAFRSPCARKTQRFVFALLAH